MRGQAFPAALARPAKLAPGHVLFPRPDPLHLIPHDPELALDRLHARVRANPLLQRFTVCTRILLAVGFIPPSLVKIQGERFTTMPVEHPVGFFSEAMYRTGAHWNFIGWA